MSQRLEMTVTCSRKQAGRQEETSCNTKQEGSLSGVCLTAGINQPLTDKTLFQYVTKMAQFVCVCVCVQKPGEKDLRCVPSGRACENLCLSCLQTTQTCLTVSHGTSPTDLEGLASIVFLQADTNIWCKESVFEVWEKQ